MKSSKARSTPLRQAQLDHLRHLWHVLLGYFRATKRNGDYPTLEPLSPPETGAIDMIAEKPGVILREVGRVLSVPKSTLTSLVDRLEQKGFIRRVVSPRDRRSFGLELTDLGRRVYDEHVAFESAAWQRALSGLQNEAERVTLIGLLERVAKTIEDEGDRS
jgi:DNA-binding MarR family transcriptional regulator